MLSFPPHSAQDANVTLVELALYINALVRHRIKMEGMSLSRLREAIYTHNNHTYATTTGVAVWLRETSRTYV